MPMKFLHKMFAALIIDWESYTDFKEGIRKLPWDSLLHAGWRVEASELKCWGTWGTEFSQGRLVLFPWPCKGYCWPWALDREANVDNPCCLLACWLPHLLLGLAGEAQNYSRLSWNRLVKIPLRSQHLQTLLQNTDFFFILWKVGLEGWKHFKTYLHLVWSIVLSAPTVLPRASETHRLSSCTAVNRHPCTQTDRVQARRSISVTT